MTITLIIILCLVCYFAWDRYFRIKLSMKFYEKQGVKMLDFVPFLGSYHAVMNFIKQNKPQTYPMIDYIRQKYGV